MSLSRLSCLDLTRPDLTCQEFDAWMKDPKLEQRIEETDKQLND